MSSPPAKKKKMPKTVQEDIEKGAFFSIKGYSHVDIFWGDFQPLEAEND